VRRPGLGQQLLDRLRTPSRLGRRKGRRAQLLAQDGVHPLVLRVVVGQEPGMQRV
jgi:hypothetical protein